MSAILSLMYVQSLFQLGAKVEKCEGYYGEQTYLDMSFWSNPGVVVTDKLDSHIGLPVLFPIDLFPSRHKLVPNGGFSNCPV